MKMDIKSCKVMKVDIKSRKVMKMDIKSCKVMKVDIKSRKGHELDIKSHKSWRWTLRVIRVGFIGLFAKRRAGLTNVSMPSMKSMRKKRIDQNTEPGRRARASG